MWDQQSLDNFFCSSQSFFQKLYRMLFIYWSSFYLFLIHRGHYIYSSLWFWHCLECRAETIPWQIVWNIIQRSKNQTHTQKNMVKLVLLRKQTHNLKSSKFALYTKNTEENHQKHEVPFIGNFWWHRTVTLH